VITHKRKPFSPNLKVLYEISKVIADYFLEHPKTQICLVHGGGSYAHAVASQYATQSTFFSENKIGVPFVTWSARKLNDRVVESFFDYNVPVFPLQTSSIIGVTGNEFKLNATILKSVLESGLIPILHGDILPNSSKPVIISGERIIELLSNEFDIQRIIVCTNTDGVFVDPQKPERGLIDCIDPSNFTTLSKSFRSSSAIDATGGMKEKVEVLYRIAIRRGVPSQIINGTKPHILRDCLHNKEVICTWIRGD